MPSLWALYVLRLWAPKPQEVVGNPASGVGQRAIRRSRAGGLRPCKTPEITSWLWNEGPGMSYGRDRYASGLPMSCSESTGMTMCPRVFLSVSPTATDFGVRSAFEIGYRDEMFGGIIFLRAHLRGGDARPAPSCYAILLPSGVHRQFVATKTLRPSTRSSPHLKR